ncbi:hypothetical protein I315_04400 [Cryptococcus gattii Ru294]|nr:hypothetical protein I315_04400 [Cryptococcus gattii Ru294]
MCLGLNTMARSQNDAKWIQMKNAVDLFKMVQLTKWARRLNIYHCQTLQYIGSFFDLTTGMFAPARSSFGPSTHMQITLWFVKILIVVQEMMAVFSDFLAERQCSGQRVGDVSTK